MTDIARQEETVAMTIVPTLRAAIYLPTHLAERDLSAWRERCIAHCVRMGYDIQVVVTGGAAAWEQLQADLQAGSIQVAVVGRREHLPPQRLPRIEEPGVEPASLPVQLPRHRERPRRIRRGRDERT